MKGIYFTKIHMIPEMYAMKFSQVGVSLKTLEGIGSADLKDLLEDVNFVMMDYFLDGMNGNELTERIRMELPNKKLLIVGVSNMSMEDDIQAALDAGMDKYFVSAHILPGELVKYIGEELGFETPSDIPVKSTISNSELNSKTELQHKVSRLSWLKENWAMVFLFGLIVWAGYTASTDDSYSSYDTSHSDAAYDVSDEANEPYIGDLSNSGGTPTYRNTYVPTYHDDPFTSNDESNDQELGYYGSETVYACNESSGNCYDLDADLYDGGVERLYFQKRGWVDIEYSDDCSYGNCYLEDENGDEWYIEPY